MKKFFIIPLGMLLAISFSYSQTGKTVITENFDNPSVIILKVDPANGWRTDTNHVSPPYSYRGDVPKIIGNSIVLQTNPYNCTGMYFVELRFKHICKIAPTDRLRIEYKTLNQGWTSLPYWTYEGNSLNFKANNYFSSASYTDWEENNNSAVPGSSWWKEEIFDVSDIVSNDPSVEFRFVLQRGTTQGTQIAYGWLIDDFQITINPFTLRNPVVEFLHPFIKDTLYRTGPYDINAKVATRTQAPIKQPELIYTAVNSQGTFTETLLMTHVTGDSIWRVTIPEQIAGTTVTYFITGMDTTGNETTISSRYHIKQISGILEQTVDYVYYSPADTAGANNNFVLFIPNLANSWSRHLYLNSELVGAINPNSPIVITDIAWYSDNSTVFTKKNDICVYLQATTATTNPPAAWLDPTTTDAQLVYQGPITGTLAWNTLILQTPFILPAGQNIIVYFVDNSGIASTPAKAFKAKANTNGVCQNMAGGILTTNVAIVRFGTGKIIDGNNSVTLSSIDNPTQLTIMGGQLNPVTVTIHNKGTADLDSVSIYWQINSGTIYDTVWKGNLPWNHKTKVNLVGADFTADAYDTLKVWLDYPNGEVDPITEDDTLTTILLGCTQKPSGTKFISRTDATSDYSSVEEVLTLVRECGAGGDLILALDTGVHPENINLENISRFMNGHSLTITSNTGNAQDVVIRPASGTAIVLNNSNKLSIKNITVDVSSLQVPAIQFTGACTNVLIRDCRLLGDTTRTSWSASNGSTAIISKLEYTGIVDSIFFIHNLIDGGQTNIYFQGGTTAAYGTHILFDSNTLSNSYFQGLYLYCADVIDFSHNIITSRTGNIPNSRICVAIQFKYANGPVIGNRIIQRTAEILYPYAIWMDSYHYSQTKDTGLIANNEIIIRSATDPNNFYWGYGIKIENSKTNILHNSIYIDDNSGNGRGIWLKDGGTVTATVKNNNIVTTGTGSYPIYLEGATSTHLWDIDYNNMYAPTYVGYAGSNQATLAQWQSKITSDRNSVRIAPQFPDLQQGLQISNYVDLLCNYIAPVNRDKNNKVRLATTTIGCYEGIPDVTTNAALIKLTGLRGGVIGGQTDNVKLVVMNTGATPINALNIEWSVNGTSKVAGGTNIPTSSSLARGQFDTLSLGTITYTPGNLDVKVWINNVNNNAVTDQIREDDTLTFSTFICGNPLNGKIPVSDTSALSSIAKALEKAALCGVSGDITLVLDSGVYKESVDLSGISNFMGSHSLTITSRTGKAEDVIIRPDFNVGVLFDNSNNVILKDISIDAKVSRSHAIYFRGSGGSNVIIRDCKLYADSSAKEAVKACGIYKPSDSYAVNNIFIVNNLINGGHANIYFYAGTSETNMGSNIIMDSNLLQNHYQIGILLYNADSSNITHNTILRDPATTNTIWNGINLNTVNGSIVSNRIHQLGNAIANPYGITVTYFNDPGNTTTKGLIANNDIIGKSTTTNGYNGGINIGAYTRADILHNSVQVKGTGVGTAFFVANSNTIYITVKNNNFVTEATGSFPIRLATTNYLSQWIFDYNNMYAPTNVGYAGGNITDIRIWKQTVLSDVYSFRIQPSFRDANTNLEMLINEKMLCPVLPNVTTDINGSNRSNSSYKTMVGAYQAFLPNIDLSLVNTVVQSGILNNSQQFPVYVEAWNVGLTAISGAELGWSIDGTDQQPYTWIATTPLASYDNAKIMLGTFTANVGDTNEIKIWINTVNGSAQTTTHNDTVSFTLIPDLAPLARFEQPLVADTINTLSFNVYTQIIEITGATVNTPEMAIQTIANNGDIFHDTVLMYFVNGFWIASIPKQYYGSKVIYSLTVTDTINNTITITDSTYIARTGTELYAGNNLSLYSIEKFASESELCARDYESVIIILANTGADDYNFAVTPITLAIEVTTPRPYYKDSILRTGTLLSGTTMTIQLTNKFPAANAGIYDVKAWINSPLDNVIYDDTLMYYYTSDKFGLPVDENFSSPQLPAAFYTKDNIGSEWEIITQGTGADTVVKPQHGTGMLAFSGNQGNMSVLSTYQLDLSQAIQPTLSFWYFHDTIPCEDYTDVRLTVDGGATYTTLFELTKYDAVYGWKEYSTNLPSFAVNQCVVLVFEAMEMSASGDVTQYIDRILITAKQEIVVTDILTSDLSLCDMKNQEWKVVLYNKTMPDLDYSTTPLEITLELIGTSYNFVETIGSGIINGFSYDTLTIASGFDFAPGQYIARAYISSIFGNIFMDTVLIKPDYTVRIHNISSSGSPSKAGIDLRQDATIKNTGNMPLSQIDLILSVNAEDISPAYHFTTTASTSGTIAPGDSVTVSFNNPYKTPWSPEYQVHVLAYLHCDSAMISKETAITEYVNIDNLALISIDKPSGQQDTAGRSINIAVTLENKSDATPFTNVKIHARVEDSKGNNVANLSETISGTIDPLQPESYTFGTSYIVPDDSVYYITVFIEKQAKDDYQQDDTIQTKRTTDYHVGIKSIDATTISMGQNVPNPAYNSTSIIYSIPASGEVIFTISSVNGQVLYNKSVKSELGTQIIDINVSHLAVGIYFYSMEFNGQRITKRMSIKR